MTDEEIIEAARKACGDTEDPLQEGGMLIMSVDELRLFITEVLTRLVQ